MMWLLCIYGIWCVVSVASHLPFLFHIVTLLVCTGPLSLRASTHGLVINIIHSLCTCSQLQFGGKSIFRVCMDLKNTWIYRDLLKGLENLLKSFERSLNYTVFFSVVFKTIDRNWNQYKNVRECGGSVVECLTGDQEAMGSSLTSVTALWSLSKTHLS